ncbi:D-alanyl-D-alanine carboxypeptidase [Microbacterium sp. SA39]|uniref:D-alanyl-D-alanine carboxypeptidase n=1 Tax=Microbacterium sp. SA39 TaxID=1263625 RepID=UPI00061E95CC|nr:D-alanyl-D-alanine carboxypeptidase [Microbacterium sp. SA39]KJQ55211.1 D-alanyl-D-alanine carboxypeptidase [Microbacterium sp. SA39]
MTVSDPADETTGVVGEADAPEASPDAERAPLPLDTDAATHTPDHDSAFATDALFAGDAPPPASAISPALPASALAVGALFSAETGAGRTRVLEDAPAAGEPPLFKPRADAPVSEEPVSPGAPAVMWAPAEDATAILEPPAQWADEEVGATALAWVDPTTVAQHTEVASLDETTETEKADGLMRGARLRPAIARPALLVPLGVLTGLIAGYAGTTLLWPLHEVPPTVRAIEFATVPAPAATVTWPAQGSAAVGIAGVSTAASAPNAVSIASITKVVSSLMVLDRMPLAPGEQGPEFRFDRGDSAEYWQYRMSDQSALDVPVNGVLTEYQMLQGTLMASANNYIDRLSQEIWGSDDEFADAAAVWLRERGLDGITVVTPSGFDEGNVATPEALVRLGEWAMKNPVFAEIVRTPSVELPGAGTVVNTNGMLADPGVVGIKTGTLVGWNLLTAKDVTVGDTTVHLFAAVLNQADDEQRLAATRSLFAEAEAALQEQAPAVAESTVVGEVTTIWGEKVDVITDEDANVVLWNGAAATSTASFELGDEREGTGEVGTLTTAGPLDSVTTPLTLAEDVEGPSPWWRLTHPFELLGVQADKP